MANVQSGRAETSAPADSVPDQEPSPPLQSAGASRDGGDDYIPHVFDFIELAKEAARYTSKSVPSIYLEPQIVDTSTLIGHGASFSASRHSLPKAARQEYTLPSMDGLVISLGQAPEHRPDYVVYKTARVAFTSTGEPISRDRKAMSSAIMELFALVHPPLLQHPNIVDYLGLAWGSNPFNPSQRLPVVVVEYADHGTLADLQEKINLSSSLRQNLCLDVALGLDILHRCGIAHGDVKAENILIFSNLERQYIAKVADFGFSVVEAAAGSMINMGGTRPWKAPETHAPVSRARLKLTDVYSFGLLVWRVATDGKSPFDLIIPPTLPEEQHFAEIERMKQADELKEFSALEFWYLPYMKKRADFQSPTAMTEVKEKLLRFASSPSLITAPTDDLDETLSQGMAVILSQGLSTDLLKQYFMLKTHRDPFYGRIDAVLKKCLGKDPGFRDLSGVIHLLQQTVERGSNNSASSGDILLSKSYNHHSVSWQKMQDLEPAVQKFLFDTFFHRSVKLAKLNEIIPSDCFLLASFYINGCGTEKNHDEAIRLVNLAAKYGQEHAQAYAYRLCKTINRDHVADDAQTTHLVQLSMKGSRTALQDLEEVAPEKVPFIKIKLHEALAGIGANFFHQTEMLHGLSHWAWMDMLADRATIAEKLEGVRNKPGFRVNRRGDGILHIAASCGKSEAVETLLDTYGIEVNQQNDQHETALLCACRAGQKETVEVLLKCGADASIATPNNESPLHWLISFTGENVQSVGTALMANGANVRFITTKTISYSVFHAGIDLDHQTPGTPLDWAVRHNRPDIVKFLLDSSGDPTICLIMSPNGITTALYQSAFFHHVECLELMVEALIEQNKSFNYDSMIAAAVWGADEFSMMLRHGSNYKKSLKKTFDFFLMKSKNLAFSGIGGFGNTLLYLAVAKVSDALVEYLLSPEVLGLLTAAEQQNSGLLSSDAILERGAFVPLHISQPCGYHRRTPILESVRRNREPIFQLLFSHGANPCVNAQNPFLKDRIDWTALHIFAYAGHNSKIKMAEDLIAAGVPIDGRLPDSTETETPLTVAIQNNAFNLASSLLTLGADINALSQSSGLIVKEHPTSILGHVIASTARHSTPRLRYLLYDCPAHNAVDFIVEPARNLSALHRAAWAYHNLRTTSTESMEHPPLRREECDMDTNRDIMYELLQRYNSQQELDRRCGVLGRTALHLAVEAGNVGAVRELVGMGADVEIADEGGETAAKFAARLFPQNVNGVKAEMEGIFEALGHYDS